MLSGKKKNKSEYESLKPSKKKGAEKDYSSVLQRKSEPENENYLFHGEKSESLKTETNNPPDFSPANDSHAENENIPHHVRRKLEKEESKSLKSEKLLSEDKWIIRKGHNLTFIGVYLFTIFVFFRPYELIPGMGFLQSGAFIIALATLLIYVPVQLSTEGTLTMFSTEVKCVLAMTALAIITMPIAKNPAMAWETFNDPFIKAVLMFIIMVNVIRTRKRLMLMLWLSLGISVYISFVALTLYMRGEFRTEGYRVSIELPGLFHNPNDMAMHLVTMMPITIALALASKFLFQRLFYLALTVLFLAASMVSFSRGGFLALIFASVLMVWKFGRDERLKYSLISMVGGGLFVLLAPGNYGLRILSIFLPGLDPVGSADARRDGLMRSIVATIRNPWGVGIGNSPIFGHRGLQTHNSYTQVSSELGLLGLAAYLIFLISPFRKLGAIEHKQYAAGERDWFYFLSIGLQGSLVAFMVASFFGSVAYLWYVYYLIAYAVAFRRIYVIEKHLETDVQAASMREKFSAFRQARQNQ